MKSISFSKKTLSLGSAISLVLILISCNLAKNDTPTFGLEKGRSEIASRLKTYETAMANRDVMTLANMYTEDAEVLSSGHSTTMGRENISKIFEGWARDSVVGSFVTTGLWGNKDLLVEQGTAIFANVKGTSKSTGRYLLVWKNVDGQWQIFRDTWFADPKAEE